MKRIMFLLIPCLFITAQAFAHCQIPCGIYDDEIRLEMIAEHITTIEKSMKSIIDFSAKKDIDYNQIVRWVNNKETHAGYIQDIVSEYFMDQRVVPVPKSDEKGYAAYVNKLTLLHQLSVYAMKAKQGLDLDNVKKLRELLKSFEEAYYK